MSQTVTRPPGPPGSTRRVHPGLTLLAVALGVMMVALDANIVAVANPVIQADLGASLADIQWVTNGYLLALAVSLITVGKFGDRFGHRRVFLIGIVGFGLTSAAIGLSGSIGLMIGLRVLQGLFGAMLTPTALALLRNTFSGKQLNMAIGAWGAITSISTGAGPIVSGVLVQHFNWQSVFYMNIPLGLIALAVGAAVLRETPREQGGSFDLPGVGLLSASLFLLIWGLIKAPSYGWGSVTTWIFLGGAVVVAALFVWREARAGQPLLPLRLFRSVGLSSGTVLVVLLMFTMFSALFFMTFYLENVFGLDPVSTGVHILPMTGTMIIAAPLASLVSNRFGPRITVVAGMLFNAVAAFGLSRIVPADGASATIVWLVLLGLGLGFVIVCATDIIVGNAPVELAGVASGIQSTAMQVGGTLGTAVLGTILATTVSGLLPGRWAAAHLPSPPAAQWSQIEQAVVVGAAPVTKQTPAPVAQLITQVAHGTFVDGLHAAFLVSAIVAVGGAVVGLFAKPGRAAEDTAEEG